MNSVGERIKMLRIKARLTQQQLADKVGGISASAIGMYEQGRRNPDMERIIRLCEVFSVSTDSLLGVKEEATDASEILDELKERVSKSNKLTVNGATMSEDEREKLVQAIEFIRTVVLSEQRTE